MKQIFQVLFLLLLFGSSLLASDNFGKLAGKIYDQSNGSALSEAVVKIENLNKGTASDMDGKYEIEGLKPGDYKIKVSYIGYTPTTVEVKVKPDEVTTLDFVLSPESSTTDTVVIEATRTQNNEAGLLVKQKNSERITDGISDQQIKKTPDAVASEVLKRINGITIVGDKFVFVRGTSERYSNTTLNGVQLPSTEPDKKAFTFDLFPSSLLENIIVSKTFTPDQTGNFSGGLVEITTKDIPDAFVYTLSSSSSFLTGTSSESNFLSYPGKESKILFFNSGLDNGSRSMPSSFPSTTLISSNFTNSQLVAYSRDLSNSWGVSNTKAPLNGAFQLSLGSRVNLFKNPLGFFAAYTYRNTFQNKNILQNGYDEQNNLRSSYSGQNSTYKVTWGALVNLSYKAGDNHKVSMKNSYVVDGQDLTQYMNGYNQDQLKKSYSTAFKERVLRSVQLNGDHLFPKLGNAKFSWLVSYSDAKRNEPDYKNMSYIRDPTSEDPNYYGAITTGSLAFDGGSRLFTKLFDISRSFKTDIEKPFKLFNSFKAKLGVAANGTRRNFEARLFAPQFFNSANIFVQQEILKQSIDSIFRPGNFRDSALYYSEYTRGSDSYTARDNMYAGYMMFDALIGKLRVVAGARMEYYEQVLNSKTDSYSSDINVYLKNTDILPAINFTYLLNDKINIRASWFQTVSRPEFREIAPFGYVDFDTREFIVGNSVDLHRSLIRNYDARLEYYPNAGEVISVGFFYKKFDSPIEEVFELTSGNNQKTFRNAEGGANNYGVELELRKNLGFIDDQFRYLTFNTNLSVISSKINLAGTSSLSSNRERRMQGQAPFMLNAGLFYDNPESGTGVNILYNRIGDRISEVGLGPLNDELEAGRDVLDVTVTQKLFKKFELKLSAKDLINQDYKFYQVSNGKDIVTRRYSGGINYSFTISYKY